jgi:hypothetical protein
MTKYEDIWEERIHKRALLGDLVPLQKTPILSMLNIEEPKAWTYGKA